MSFLCRIELHVRYEGGKRVTGRLNKCFAARNVLMVSLSSRIANGFPDIYDVVQTDRLIPTYLYYLIVDPL